MHKDKFEVLELTGSPHKRGIELGSKKELVINNFVGHLFSKLAEDDVKKEEALNHIKKHIPFIEKYSPDIADELKGIAEGANKKYEEIVLITMLEELKSFSHNCTAFALTGKTTKTGDTFIGQSWDISKELCECADSVIVKMRREKGPDFISYTYSGLAAGAGINTEGISLVWNSVPRLELNIGVPTHVIIEEILCQETIGGALSAICRADRAGCFNFIIADKSEIYDIEATPDDVNIDYSNSYIGHANHYVSNRFKYKQDIAAVAQKYDASSIIRHNRINSLLKENSGNIDIKSLKTFLKDHVNYPESICRHVNPKTSVDKQVVTCSSFIMTPSKGEVIITDGPPCENNFNKYVIKKDKGEI